MRLLLLVLVAGCHTSEMDYPVGGGGGGGNGGTFRDDAAIDGSGSGSAFVATACVLTDVRDLTSCRTTGSAGLTVTLGTATAITADDGSFTIAAPAIAGVLWDVTDVTRSTVVQSVTAFTGQTRIPVMDAVAFTELRNINGVLPVAGTGSVMIRVTRGGVPVTGEQVVVSPTNDIDTFYDPAIAGDAWTTTGTGAFGTAYLPNVTPGTASLTLSAGGTMQGTLSGIPITDGGVTFVQAVLL